MRSYDKLRLFAARASLAVVGGAFFAEGVRHSWRLAAMGALVAGASVLLGRRSALSQVLARGVAWAVVLPAAFHILLAVRHGYAPGFAVVAEALGAALALGLSRPMLESDEAKREFAPVVLRRWLLASATTAVGFGVAIGRFATELLAFHITGPAIAFGLLAALSTLAGVGVARMRSWGVLAGAAASAVAVAMAPVVDWALLAPAVPGLMMVAAVVMGRLGVGRRDAASAIHVRISRDAEPATRVRVDADLDPAFDELEAAPPSPRRAALPHHGSRDAT